MIAIDQHGYTYQIKGDHPRKELLERVGGSSAQKMYVDILVENKEPQSVHCGYIINGLWLTLYKLSPWQQQA